MFIDLYDGVKHMFTFLCLKPRNKRRHAMIAWKTYYTIIYLEEKGSYLEKNMNNFND